MKTSSDDIKKWRRNFFLNWKWKRDERKTFFFYYGLLNAITNTHIEKAFLRVIILNRGFIFELCDNEEKTFAPFLLLKMTLRWFEQSTGKRWKTLKLWMKKKKKLRRWLLCDFSFIHNFLFLWLTYFVMLVGYGIRINAVNWEY